MPVLEGDMIEFYLNNSRHVINVEKVMPESLDLDIFLFVDEDQRVSYLTASKGKTIKIDVNKDGKSELYLGYAGHFSNKSLIFFYTPDSENTLSDITGNVIAENQKTEEKSYKLYYLGGILILVIVLISILLYINTRKKEI